MISFSPDLPNTLQNSAVILDTCVLVLASKLNDLRNLLHRIRTNGGILVTTSSVHVELLRGARTPQEALDLEMLFGSLGIITIENADAALVIPDGRRFMIMINKSTAKNPAYVDMQLLQVAACLYIPNRSIKLMTSNFRDVPVELYDCEDLISTSNSDGLQTIGVYSINQRYFKKRLSEIK